MEVLDVRGEACPIPVVKSLAKIKEMSKPDILEVHVDNEIATQNLSKMAQNKGCLYKMERRNDKHYVVSIDVLAEEDIVQNTSGESIVVAIGSRYMGSGDDKLGALLMKGFIYAISKLERLPDSIIFYNSGAYVSIEDSDSMEDLREMESEGVNIITCGTCLDYYNIKDKLAVGEISDMYTIVETLASADKVIRP